MARESADRARGGPAAKGKARAKPKTSGSGRATHGEVPELPRLLYSITEAAAVLGIPRRTAYVLVQRGVIPTIDDYGRKMVPAKGLEEDVERRVRRALDGRSASAAAPSSAA